MSHAVNTQRNRVWDVDTLSWVKQQQSLLKTDTLTVSISGVATAANQTSEIALLSGTLSVDPTGRLGLSWVSGNVSATATLITPAAGKRVRVYYASYNPASAVLVNFQFGAAGTAFLLNLAPAGSIIAKDLGDSRYIQGAVDEVLKLTLGSAVSTNYNVFYVEV